MMLKELTLLLAVFAFSMPAFGGTPQLARSATAPGL
jgi:hypothetical protein